MRSYVVVIERGAQNYSAYSPDVPGCVATGVTVDETVARFQQALTLHLQGLREDGLPLPEATSEVARVVANV